MYGQFWGLHHQHDGSRLHCRSETKTEIQERRCSGWRWLNVELCRLVTGVNLWTCAFGLGVLMLWYLWDLHCSSQHQSSASLGSSFACVPSQCLFLLAPVNPVVIKFSGGVFPVSFICHHFWHLSFGCDFAFADLRLLGLCADFRRQKVPWDRQESLAQDTAKLQITVLWKRYRPAREQNSLSWNHGHPGHFFPFLIVLFLQG